MQYSVTSGAVTGGTTKTILTLLSAATRRPRLIQLIIGCSGAAADNVALFKIQRITADGTGTAVTPLAADGGDGAATCTAKANYTVEPTYLAGDGIQIALNQRATLVWNVPVSYLPALGSGPGIGIQMLSGPALAYVVTAFFEE